MFKQSKLMIGVVGFMLVAFTACVQPAQPEAVVVVPQGVTVAGGVTITEGDGQLDSEYLATNPELKAVKRYAGVVQNEEVSESEFYATNPELIVANRYSAPGAVADGDSAYFAANPELMAANHYNYNQAEAMTDSEYFASNPELMAVRD